MNFGRILAGSAVAVSCAAAAATPAEAQVRQFDIPAGPLKPALEAFAHQSGQQVIYRLVDVRGRRTPGVRGRVTAGAALQSLLSPNGLTWRVGGSGAIAIIRLDKGQLGTTERPGRIRGPTEVAETAAPPEEIVITGSRIKLPRSALASPTITLSGEELFHTGRTAIGETLNDLPALRSTVTQGNSTRNVTGAGLNMLDLRGLGIDRTLVLQNGRRHISGAPFTSAVDINTIPSALIDRIEIVSGGSSAVYGSDAIAGVVNFILKSDFEGFEVRGQGGASGHGDAYQMLLSGTAGTNFADERGNVAASVEVAHQDDWYASDRPKYRNLASYVFVDVDPPDTPNASDGISDRVLVRDFRGFSASSGGTFVDLSPGPDGNVTSYLFQPDGGLVRQTGERVGLSPFAGFNGGSGSNLHEGKLVSYAPDLKRYSFNLLGHFTISDAVEPFVEAKYVKIRSTSGTGGSFFTVGIWGPRERYYTNNPFLQPEARDFIRSSIGLADGEEDFFFFRRNFEELGPLTQNNRRETYRLVGGVRGKLGGNWSYEVSANRARAMSRTRFTGNVNIQRYLLAIDAVRDPESGEIVCRSRIDPSSASAYEGAADPAFAMEQLAGDVAACVPLNPFGEGNISPAARDYILADGSTRSRIKQVVLNGFLSGDSSNWFELPGGPVGMAVGAEYRRERFRNVQDELITAGLTHSTSQPAFRPPSFSVKEAFGEVRLPLLKSVPGFRELTVSGAARVADYRGSVGTVFAWNMGSEWAPLEGLRFRLTRSRAIRAPNLFETYQPVGQNFTSGVIRDPCSVQSIGSGSSAREANCRADGVPEGFSFTYSSSFPFRDSGNRDLHAETSDSLTVGALVRPAAIPGLSLSADYYDIKVRDVITSPTVQSILNSCYDAPTLENPFCALFDRNHGPGSGPRGESPGQIIQNSLRVIPLNYAALKVRGIDVQAAYRRTVPMLGALSARLIYTLALENDSFLDPKDRRRKDQNLLELGNPRHALNLDMSLKRGRVTMSYQWRYLSKMSVGAIENIRSVQGRDPEDADAFEIPYFSPASYHNVRVAMDVSPVFSLYAGVDNLTDRLPPASITGISDEGGIYDTIGRFFYAGAVARF